MSAAAVNLATPPFVSKSLDGPCQPRRRGGCEAGGRDSLPSQFSLQSPTITCVPRLPRPNGPNITSNPRGFCPSSHLLSLTRGQAVVWPKFSASGCQISLNVPLTPGLAIILEKLGKSETRERQIFKRNEVYHGRSNFRNFSNFSHENDLCKPAFNNIKVFSFQLSGTSHNAPCFHFTGEIGKACFAQTLSLVKLFATAFQRRQQQHPLKPFNL